MKISKNQYKVLGLLVAVGVGYYLYKQNKLAGLGLQPKAITDDNTNNFQAGNAQFLVNNTGLSNSQAARIYEQNRPWNQADGRHGIDALPPHTSYIQGRDGRNMRNMNTRRGHFGVR